MLWNSKPTRHKRIDATVLFLHFQVMDESLSIPPSALYYRFSFTELFRPVNWFSPFLGIKHDE